jgi:hypothetical protein
MERRNCRRYSSRRRCPAPRSAYLLLLLRFRLRNAQVRLPQEEHMTKLEKWKLFKGSWISIEPVLPGVWRRKEGGHVVRARAKEGTTGKQKEIWKVLPEADAPSALQWLKNEQHRLRAGVPSATQASTLFSEFAA